MKLLKIILKIHVHVLTTHMLLLIMPSYQFVCTFKFLDDFILKLNQLTNNHTIFYFIGHKST